VTVSSAADWPEIRRSVPSDRLAIEALYPRAFPDEDLVPLVQDLLEKRNDTVSLVAVIDSNLVGNIIFTIIGVDAGHQKAALLAPLAVSPKWQRQGIGSALVRTGLHQLLGEGISAVYVLGDPAYYGRLGFSPERSVRTPYPLPSEWADAWQSQTLGDAVGPAGGKLSLPEVWLDPALWSA
jgi:putative acetyltransferase